MTAVPPRDPAFESLLEFLKASRSFDFTGYKRSTLMRRVQKRMQALEVDAFDAYRDHLELNPDEYEALFNTILINVTSFFRDTEAWRVLAEEFIPALLERKPPSTAIRVWSAGCASGQETYTLVMLLAEALGPEEFRERVKVYATDWDEEALAEARHATYTTEQTEELPEGFRDRYFEPAAAGQWVFRGDLRRQVIFGRHDLVQDAPISHLDLLVCRNVLMYFNAEVQQRILARFHFALAPEGVLFLGKAEMMRSHANLFTPAHLQARVFRKAQPGTMRDRLLMLGTGTPTRGTVSMSAVQQLALRDAALNALPAAQITVSTGGHLMLANDAARRLFALTPADMGRPLQDLKVSYRPVELRSRIEQAVTERRPVYMSGVSHAGDDGDARSYDVQVCPLEGGPDGLLGVAVSFFDVTRFSRLQAEVEQAHQSLETAFEELQSTNEELETTNEELQSTIEELETTNEELQSTNEELETMNEELQSTNEELETLNDELQRRSGELNDANAYLSSVLTSLRAAVVVVDRDMLVQLWNRSMEDMWGLRADEVSGQPLLHLDMGLPVEQLKAPVRAVLEGRTDAQELVLDAINRRGRPVRCRVMTSPLLSLGREIRGSVIVIEDEDLDSAVAAPVAARGNGA
jgi:two-component system, chemotaxis family, CheB/CheR fusion protein